MGSIALILLLLVALVSRASWPAGSILSSSWQSDDSGRMVVSMLEPNGSFLGSYLPEVAAGDSHLLALLLKGMWQDAELAAQSVFSFVVHWRRRGVPGGRTKAFVGQCCMDKAGKEALHVLWLLRNEMENPDQDWKATRIGTSTFTRIKCRPAGKPGE